MLVALQNLWCATCTSIGAGYTNFTVWGGNVLTSVGSGIHTFGTKVLGG